MIIKIKDYTGERAVLDSDGDKVCKLIKIALKENDIVVLDFGGVNTILSIFTNAAIGALYEDYTSEFLNEHLKIENMSLEDKKSLKRVNERAKQFYSEKNSMRAFLEEEVFDEE